MHTLVAPACTPLSLGRPHALNLDCSQDKATSDGQTLCTQDPQDKQGSYMPTVEPGDGLLSLQLVGVGHKGAAARLAVVVAQDVQLHYLPQGQEDLLQVPLGGLPKQTLSALCGSHLHTCEQAGYQRPYVQGPLSRDLDQFHQGRHVCYAAVLVYWLHAWAAPR